MFTSQNSHLKYLPIIAETLNVIKINEIHLWNQGPKITPNYKKSFKYHGSYKAVLHFFVNYYIFCTGNNYWTLSQ